MRQPATPAFSSAVHPAVLALLLFAAALLLLAPSASADTAFGEGTIGGPNTAGALVRPEGIAVDPASGKLFVADSFTRRRVAAFEAGGASLFAFGWGVLNGAEEEQTCTTACVPGPFSNVSVKGGKLASPEGVAVDPAGEHDLYVADGGYHRVAKFKPNGEFLLALGGDVVAYGPDNSANDEVQKVIVTAEGGTYELGFPYPWTVAAEGGGGVSGNEKTTALPYNATAAEVEATLDALDSVNGTEVSGGALSVSRLEKSSHEFEYTITFEGNLSGDDVPQLRKFGDEATFSEPQTLTGATHTIAVQTTHPGGATEVCKPAAGDVCKEGGDRASGAPGTFSPWPFPADVLGVGPEGGVYVGDQGRVEKFSSEGAYLGQLNISGAGKVEAVAVDGEGHLYTIAAGLAGVQQFDSSCTGACAPLRTLHPEGQPRRLTTDAANDLFVGTELHGGEPDVAYEFARYDSAGTLLAQFHSSLLRPVLPENDPIGYSPYSFHVAGLAVGDAAQQLYATNLKQRESSEETEEPLGRVVAVPLPAPGPPAVEGLEVTDTEPTTATLRGVVNPREFDTTYQFQYITQKRYEEDGDSFGLGTVKAPEPPADLGIVNREDHVQAAISALEPATEYRWRLLAKSTAGEPQAESTLTTLPPVSVRNFTTHLVAPEEVILKAQLSPDNSLAPSHWEICLGEAAGNYNRGCVAGELHVHGNEFEEITATFTGLHPNTAYHYILRAGNEYTAPGHPEETPDQALTTEETLAEQDAREGCANALRREEDNSLALPDCRAYEQVSAVQKEGSQAFAPHSLAPGGERVLYESGGIFAGAAADEVAVKYLAQRTPAGWASRPVLARLAPGYWPHDFGTNAVPLFSPELDRWLFAETAGRNSEEALSDVTSVFYSLGLADGTYAVHATPTLSLLDESQPRGLNYLQEVIGQTSDLSHIFVLSAGRFLASDPRPGDGPVNLRTRIYSLTGVGGPSPSLALAAELPEHLTVSPQCSLDEVQAYFGPFEPRLTSADGSVLFYTSPIEEQAGQPCGPGQPNPVGLFAKTGEAAPVQLDAPPPTQCSSPAPCAASQPQAFKFYGASPDGRLAWFTTARPLIDSDTDATRDLYLAKLNPSGQLESLFQASRGEAEPGTADGDGADLQGVLASSPDGTHLAFVAKGVLTDAANSQGAAAQPGADNLYVYDATSGTTEFAARLCSGPEKSGSTADPACPADLNPEPGAFEGNDTHLWRDPEPHEAQFTPDGRFLLLTTYGRLTSDDTDNAPDLYRYGFAGAQLQRLSFGSRGNDAGGNDDAYPAYIPRAGQAGALAEDKARAISADGSRVLFATAAPLVSRDTDGISNPSCEKAGVAGANVTGCDIYQWEESGRGTCAEPGGCVSLISSGHSPQGSRFAVISASGRDITFATQQGLVPADTDGVGDIYDAREAGGFPYAAPPPHPPCVNGSAEACHGESTRELLPTNPVTENLHSGGNGPRQLACAKGKHKVKKHGQVRCVPNQPKKHHKKKSHKRHKRANTNRRASK